MFKAIAEGICPYDSNRKIVAVKTLKGKPIQYPISLCTCLGLSLVTFDTRGEWLLVLWPTSQCGLYKVVIISLIVYVCTHEAWSVRDVDDN